jgi:multidrug efflux pump subunit AcrA (membrane-fusion protein)
MRTYAVIAPFSGIVLARNTSVGDVAADNTLFDVADLSEVWVDLRALGTDAERLAPGQQCGSVPPRVPWRLKVGSKPASAGKQRPKRGCAREYPQW